jgi:hypothetical protein
MIRMIHTRRTAALAAGGLLVGAGAYLGLVTASVPIDLGIGRRTRPLGPLEVHVAATPQIVFDVIAAPYAERTSRALRDKVEVLERGTDMVLATHYTPLRGRLRATTVETVRFTRPQRIDFRLVRGPVPRVIETFHLDRDGHGTRISYTGELGTDLWGVGGRWGNLVAATWQTTVQATLDAIKHESERRAAL